MADYPPFMNAYGNVTKILEKIKEAKTPERFSVDYLDSVLGFSGGSASPFIGLAKRIGLLNTDGTPTELYHRFRNPAQSEQAMAEAIKIGYPELYRRNEYAHVLEKEKLTGLVVEATGLETGSKTLRAIVATFEALKAFANFDLGPSSGDGDARELNGDKPQPGHAGPQATPASDDEGSPGMSLSTIASGQTQANGITMAYSINLNLPDTSDQAVFNAIFKALREHLLDV